MTSDFLERVVARALGTGTVARRRRAAMFAPQPLDAPSSPVLRTAAASRQPALPSALEPPVDIASAPDSPVAVREIDRAEPAAADDFTMQRAAFTPDVTPATPSPRTDVRDAGPSAYPAVRVRRLSSEPAAVTETQRAPARTTAIAAGTTEESRAARAVTVTPDRAAKSACDEANQAHIGESQSYPAADDEPAVPSSSIGRSRAAYAEPSERAVPLRPAGDGDITIEVSIGRIDVVRPAPPAPPNVAPPADRARATLDDYLAVRRTVRGR